MEGSDRTMTLNYFIYSNKDGAKYIDQISFDVV